MQYYSHYFYLFSYLGMHPPVHQWDLELMLGTPRERACISIMLRMGFTLQMLSLEIFFCFSISKLRIYFNGRIRSIICSLRASTLNCSWKARHKESSKQIIKTCHSRREHRQVPRSGKLNHEVAICLAFHYWSHLIFFDSVLPCVTMIPLF